MIYGVGSAGVPSGGYMVPTFCLPVRLHSSASSWCIQPFQLAFQELSPSAAEFCRSPRWSFVRWSWSLPTSFQIPLLLR